MDDELSMLAYLGFVVSDGCFPAAISVKEQPITILELVNRVSDTVESMGLYCSYQEWSQHKRQENIIAITIGRTLFDEVSNLGISLLAMDRDRVLAIAESASMAMKPQESWYVH